MKKLLLSLAVVLGLMPAINANAEVATLTQKWIYNSEELGSGWDGTAPNWSSTDAIKAQACARFATAADGKIYTLNMKTMSIAQITADGVTDLYKLPSLEGITVDVAGTATPDYYGTSISLDQAGNFIVGHMFTKAQSVLRYTVYSPKTNKAKHFDLTVPDGMMVMRNDCMGRVLGDMTKDAYAYIAPGDFVQAGGVVTPGSNGGGTYATNQKVRVLHFTGDGDVDNIAMTDQWSGMIYLGSHLAYNNICQPIYASMEEAKDVPATSTFMSASAYQPGLVDGQAQNPTATYFGFNANGSENWGYSGLGNTINAATNGFDTFVLDGKRYYVRNNMAETNLWKAFTMDVAVYDEAFNIVAQWKNPDYTSNQGYSSIVAEPVEGGANIYVYNSTGNVNDEKKNYSSAAMLFFAPGNGEVAPDGTAEHPYKISTPADLGAMSDKLISKTPVYFVLENDIDMAGYENYKPACGYDNVTYDRVIFFDGQNHVIKNFKQERKNYFYTSIFGVLSGEVKNLGVENADIDAGGDGAGVLAAYAGHSSSVYSLTQENVYATGKIASAGSYVGGLIGTTGVADVKITNCYAQVDVTATKTGAYAGGIVGRVNNPGLTITNCYASGSVKAGTIEKDSDGKDVFEGTGIVGGIVGGKNAATLTNVIAWNSSLQGGEDDTYAFSGTNDATTTDCYALKGMMINGVAAESGKTAEELAAVATAWPAYQQNLYHGYPVLAWQVCLGTEENPFVIATAEDLVNLKDNMSAFTNNDVTYIKLANDIDMTDTPLASFNVNTKGILHVDGQQHVIKNLTMNGGSTGIFLNFSGSIKNLGLENVTANGGGWDPAGTLIAYAKGEALIENCFTTGTVTGFYAGGLAAGVQTNGKLTIRNCYSWVNASTSTGFAGGLVGPCNQNATLVVENSYAAGDVINEGWQSRFAGGISAGMNNNYTDNGSFVTLKNVVAWNGTIKANTAADALVVPLANLLTVETTDCLVWDGTTVNDAPVEGAVNAYELQKTVTGWEAFNEKLVNGMPVLAWQEATEDLVDPTLPGGELNPYKVGNADELFDLYDALTEAEGGKAYVEFTADVDMSDEAWNIIDTKATVYVDGKNHVIKNLNCGGEISGLFRNFDGSIKNLGLENLTSVSSSQWGLAGGLMAYAVGTDVVVDNCFVTGTVNGYYAGAISSGVQSGAKLTVTNSYARADVTTTFQGGILIGGLNTTAAAVLENVYAYGTVAGNWQAQAGGLAAGVNTYAPGEGVNITMKNVVSWATSLEGATTGIFAGAHDLCFLTFENAEYWNGMTLKGEAVAEGGKTTEELQTIITGWEAFNDKLNDGMPVLAWQDANGSSAVENIEAVENAAPVFYNLQGVRVQNPANGVYIVKRGNKVSKVFIR